MGRSLHFLELRTGLWPVLRSYSKINKSEKAMETTVSLPAERVDHSESRQHDATQVAQDLCSLHQYSMQVFRGSVKDHQCKEKELYFATQINSH